MKLYAKLRKLAKNKKAMTALQTAILTGVSIAVALIVGYWIWTVVVGSIHTEKLTLTLPTASYDSQNEVFTIKVTVQNTGPSDTTIVDIRVNGKTYSEWSSETSKATLGQSPFDTSKGYPISAGSSVQATITLDGTKYAHGQTVEIAFVTSSNQVYTCSVTLP